MRFIVRMLHNQKIGTYHPIFYMESPLPGPLDSEVNTKLVRYKSKMHHTEGFRTREAAVASINEELEQRLRNAYLMSELKRELDTDMEWDGDSFPIDMDIESA